MSPFNDIGRILRDVYEQNQRQAQRPAPGKQDVPRLAGGLWGAFGFEEAAEKYKLHLKDHYGFLHILGHHKPVSLEGVFTDVYLYDRPLALRRLEARELEEQFRQRQTEPKGTKRIEGLSLVEKERRLFILGQPGAGKTTFLKHIALQVAKGELPGVPVFISLKALADSEKSLLDFMAQEMRICGFPEPPLFIQLMLQTGKMLVLLDGLDEVTQAQESALKLTQGIENVIRQFADNHFLITCRTAVTDYQFPGFTSVEMADFSQEQVIAFIQKWFQHDPDTGKTCLTDLNWSQHVGLRELSRTPLLLNLLCLIYDERKHFPQRRLDLYEEGLDALLSKWDSTRRIYRDEVYRQLKPGHKKQMLSQIAYATFTQGKYFIPKAQMVQHILDYLRARDDNNHPDESDGEAVLRAIEAHHGVIVERARGVYSFAHLTFQEYFTAKYLVEAGQEPWANMFPHCFEPQWREVFLLTTSLLADADAFFGHFVAYLDEWVSRDAQLQALLTWTNGKATVVGESTSALILQRSLYVYLARARDLTGALNLARDLTGALNFARDLFTPDLARVLALALDLARDLARARDLGLASARDLARTLTLTLAHTPTLTLGLGFELVSGYTRAPTLRPLIALDFALVHGWLYGQFGLAEPFIELAIRICQEQGLSSLQRGLERLSVSGENAPRSQRERFARSLWQLAQQERQLQLFELSEEQARRLADYLEGTTLLLECLQLAAVTDREGIMRRLLAPPGV